MKSRRENVSPVETAGDDQLSSSSSSDSESSPSTSRARAQHVLRRITHDQLTRALSQFANSANSLSSLSQRIATNNSNQPSPAPSGSGRSEITPSMVMNALSGVLRSGMERRQEQSGSETPLDIPPTETPPVSDSTPTPAAVNEDIDMDDPDARMIASFQPQLMQMQEMGLFNKSQNIQALMICNGDLEAAVNLVLSETIN